MTLLVSFLDGDANPGGPAPECHRVLSDGLAEIVSEEAAVFWDRDVAVGGGSVGDEQLRVVRRFGTWRAFKSQPEDPNAFVAEWDAHAVRWWVGPEQHSGKRAVPYAIDYPEGDLGGLTNWERAVPSLLDRSPTLDVRLTNAQVIARGHIQVLVSRRWLEERDHLGDWTSIPDGPDLQIRQRRREGKIIRRVIATDYLRLTPGGRHATHEFRSVNWIEGGLGAEHDRWLLTQIVHRQAEADGIEIRLGAYANLIQQQPPVVWIDEAADISPETADRVLDRSSRRQAFLGRDPGEADDIAEAEYSRAVEAEFPPDDDY